MSAKDTLRYLFPFELGGVHAVDLEHDGRMLDLAKFRIDQLLAEGFADTAVAFLTDFERVYALTPQADEPLAMRRARVIRKIRERGGLSRPYFIALAAAMGYSIEIEEPVPSMTDWACADDELMSEDVVWQWGVKISGVPLYVARADESCADDLLLWWPSQSELEDVFQRLKPAHTFVYFDYSEAQ